MPYRAPSSGTRSSGSKTSDPSRNDDENEKEAKVKRSSAQRFQQFIVCFGLFMVAAFLVGHKLTTEQQEQQSLHIDPPIRVRHVGESSTVTKKGGVPIEDSPLAIEVDELDAKVRAHKKTPGMIMETDPTGLKLTKELQQLTHKLLIERYGKFDDGLNMRVQVDVLFPETIPDYTEATKTGQILIEMAPIDLLPCSVFRFLEIARTWKSGAFHRNANHVLQVQTFATKKKSMPFQEYSPEHPHRKGTVGYAGRPSGPGWYVSIMDNTENHGPGSQQKKNPYEADSNFGNVIQGMDDVVPRIHTIPEQGWLKLKNQIKITKMTILIPDGAGSWVPWSPPAP